MQRSRDNVGLLSPLFADGRHLLTLGTLGLLFSGAFALFLAATGQFLPHDVQFLGMTATELCSHNACNIVHFMIHDRASFGGTLIALSVLYLWLIHFQLRAGEGWAWWTLFLSNVGGFASFLTYRSFGYLDSWHAWATVFLLPCFIIGLIRTYSHGSFSSLLISSVPLTKSRAGVGRAIMLGTSFGLFVAGLTIMIVGMTVVFVPQDLQYMETTARQLNAINPRLIPLIAHDRAGFGTAVLNVGFLMLAITWCAKPSANTWQATALALGTAFAIAIGVHPFVGYNNPVHLAPACLGAALSLVAIILTYQRGYGRFFIG